MADQDTTTTSHDDWIGELDRIGAAASSGELWRLWSSAPDTTTEDARHLFNFLITNYN